MSTNEDELPDNFDGELVKIGRGYEDLKELYDRVRDIEGYNQDPTAATYEDATEFINAIKELVPGEDHEEEHLLQERSNQVEADSLNGFKDENEVVYILDPENAEEEYIWME